MVDKDFNHPCVVMYSTGNEVAESAQEKGIQLQQDFTSYLHILDATRPVTCGINIFFNFLSSMGMGVYSDEKAKANAEAAAKAAQTLKTLVLLLAALGLATLWMAVFADVGVTVLAVLNALRALRVCFIEEEVKTSLSPLSLSSISIKAGNLGKLNSNGSSIITGIKSNLRAASLKGLS